MRIEIATALKRDIRAIPVLVDGAAMPRSGDLPDDLKPLVRRNALQLSHDRFRTDSERLASAVERALETAKAEQQCKREEEQRLKTNLVFQLQPVVSEEKLLIRGRVTNEKGEPIVGAKISVFDGEREIAKLDWDGGGRFEFSNEKNLASPSLKVVVAAEGFFPLVKSVASKGETNSVFQRQPIVSEEELSIAGRGANEKGEPIIGAKINIFDGKTEIAGMDSDPDGKFKFSSEIRLANPRLKVVVTAQRFEPLERSISSKGETDLVLQLHPAVSEEKLLIAGRVTNEKGEPIVGAKISIFDGEREIAKLNSDGGGGFEFSNEKNLASHRLKVVVTARRFKPLERSVNSEGETGLVLQLRPVVSEEQRRFNSRLFSVTGCLGIIVVFVDLVVHWIEGFRKGSIDSGGLIFHLVTLIVLIVAMVFWFFTGRGLRGL